MTDTIIEVLTQNLLETVMAVIAIVVAYYVIPAIKNDLIPWLQEKRIYDEVQKLVAGVEKMYEVGILKDVDKKELVVTQLEAKGIEVTDEVEILIEASVKNLDLIGMTFIQELGRYEENKQ